MNGFKSIKITDADYERVEQIEKQTNLGLKDTFGACIDAWEKLPEVKRKRIVERRHERRREQRRALSGATAAA